MKSGKKLFQKIQIKDKSKLKQSPFHQGLQVQSKNNDKQQSEIKNVSINLPYEQSFDKNLEESKISQLNNNFNQLSQSIGDLKNQYKDLKKSQKSIKIKKKQDSAQESKVKQFINAKRKEKAERQKNMQKRKQMEQLKRQEIQQKQKHEESDRKIRKLEQIRKISASIKDKTSLKKQDQKQKQKKAQQLFKKYKDKVPLFQIKEREDKDQKIKKQVEIKQIIKKRKEIYKPMDQKQLQDHQKVCIQKLEKLTQQKQQAKIKQLTKIIQDNVKMKDLYRGKGSDNYINQVQELQQKKQIPFRVRTKIKDYQQYVKQNYLPKYSIRQKRGFSSSLDLKAKRNQDSTQSFRQIRRYKYLHGVSYGSVLQAKPSPKSYTQQKKIGNGYMEFMKSLPKKKHEKVIDSFQIPIPLKHSRANPLSHNRKKSPRVNLNDEPTRQEINMVLLQLRNYDKKINKKQKIVNQKSKNHRQSNAQIKQIDEDLLFNIQKKMNLLHKLQTQ